MNEKKSTLIRVKVKVSNDNAHYVKPFELSSLTLDPNDEFFIDMIETVKKEFRQPVEEVSVRVSWNDI